MRREGKILVYQASAGGPQSKATCRAFSGEFDDLRSDDLGQRTIFTAFVSPPASVNVLPNVMLVVSAFDGTCAAAFPWIMAVSDPECA